MTDYGTRFFPQRLFEAVIAVAGKRFTVRNIDERAGYEVSSSMVLKNIVKLVRLRIILEKA